MTVRVYCIFSDTYAHQNHSVVIAREFLKSQKQTLNVKREQMRRSREDMVDEKLRDRLTVRFIHT